jgi:hypothetical protein
MLLMSALLMLLTAALTASFGNNVRLLRAAILGSAAGCLAGLVLVLGAASPFALELGERDLTTLGGDLAWKAALAAALATGGGVGALVGAGCGAVAWAMLAVLGHSPNGRERQTEA